MKTFQLFFLLLVAGCGPSEPPGGQDSSPAKFEMTGKLESRELLEASGLQAGNVAAVAVEEEKAVEAMAGQGVDHVLDDRHQGAGPKSNGAGKAEMVLGHADGKRRRHKRARGIAQTARQNLWAESIGADKAVGAMLFGRPYGNHHTTGTR